MARWRDDLDPVPARLAWYDVRDWAGVADPVGVWAGACHAWLGAERGRRLPWGDGGDPLDVARAAVRLGLLAMSGAGRVLSGEDLTRLAACRWHDVLPLWGRPNGQGRLPA